MASSLSSHGVSIPTGSTRWDSSWPRYLGPSEAEPLFSYFRQRFGIKDESLHGLYFFERGETYWVLRSFEEIEPLSTLKVNTVGIPAFRKVKGGELKPTSAILRLLGREAVRNTITLSYNEAFELLRTRRLRKEHGCDPGYVIIKVRDGILGCGLARRGIIISQIPKEEIAQLKGPLRSKLPK